MFAGTVSGSFARSAQATGLTSAEVAELSQVLEKKLDFRRDTRRGDRFEVLVESDIIDGQSLDPRILAVKYDGSRMDLTLLRNPQDNQFYTPDGVSSILRSIATRSTVSIESAPPSIPNAITRDRSHQPHKAPTSPCPSVRR